MLPQSELDNYKLQVELLQEKLQRSEENRQQLEQQLRETLHKRTEHDKLVRSKTRHKYQQFLDEQKKRNERNKLMVQMLERIDQQTATLSARSERLKMMKLQYEMYFAKLMQSQTMRSIQTTAAPIPVFVPTSANAVIASATPIMQNIEQNSSSNNAAATAPPTFCLTPNSNIAALTVDTTTAAAAQANLTPRHWTLTMATPTPTGMLLGTAGVQPTAATYDYLQYPIGYVPRSLQSFQYQQQPLLLQPPTLRNPTVFDQRDDFLATNRSSSSSNEKTKRKNAERISLCSFDETNDATIENATDLPTTSYQRDDFHVTPRATASENLHRITTPPTPQTTTNEQQSLHAAATVAPTTKSSSLSFVSSPSSATLAALTFDKLPLTGTMTAQNSSATSAERDASRNEDVAVTSVLSKMEPQDELRLNGFSAAIDEAALPQQPRIMAEFEKAKTARPHSGSNEKIAAPVPINSGYAAAYQRQVIDNESWQPTQRERDSKNWSADEANATLAAFDNYKKNTPAPAADAYEAPNIVEAQNRNATPVGLLAAANTAGVEQELVANVKPVNQFIPSQVEGIGASAMQLPSIEKIENAIYGELVNPPSMIGGETQLDTHKPLPQTLLDDLVTQPQIEVKSEIPTTQSNEVLHPPAATTQPEYDNYPTYAAADDTSASYNPESSESYDPTYATIDGTANAEVYPNATIGAYAEGSEYAQYGDPNAAPQDYDANVDYSNYDASQYAAAYDPNQAYPGYTYDEATGQYIPDVIQPEEQQQQAEAQQQPQEYLGENSYAAAQYDVNQQEVANYDYAAYTPETELTNAAYATPAEALVEVDPAANQQQLQQEPVSLDGDAPKSSKPTSILATDKQATAANDASKKKKRVNFVDNSETEDSSSTKAAAAAAPSAVSAAASHESDFDFSTGSESVQN